MEISLENLYVDIRANKGLTAWRSLVCSKQKLPLYFALICEILKV